MPRVTPPSPRSGFIEPCLPSSAERPPSGPDWIHEIKHDGYRITAPRREAPYYRGDTNGHLLDESQSKGMDGHAARLRVPRRANLRCEDHMDHHWLGCRIISWRG